MDKMVALGQLDAGIYQLIRANSEELYQIAIREGGYLN